MCMSAITPRKYNPKSTQLKLVLQASDWPNEHSLPSKIRDWKTNQMIISWFGSISVYAFIATLGVFDQLVKPLWILDGTNRRNVERSADNESMLCCFAECWVYCAYLGRIGNASVLVLFLTLICQAQGHLSTPTLVQLKIFGEDPSMGLYFIHMIIICYSYHYPGTLEVNHQISWELHLRFRNLKTFLAFCTLEPGNKREPWKPNKRWLPLNWQQSWVTNRLYSMTTHSSCSRP